MIPWSPCVAIKSTRPPAFGHRAMRSYSKDGISRVRVQFEMSI
jgi:hypothetical protein